MDVVVITSNLTRQGAHLRFGGAGRLGGASHPGHAVVGSAPMSTSIDVVINGQTRGRSNAGTTVAALIAELGLGDRRVAVERNREVVPRAQHATTRARRRRSPRARHLRRRRLNDDRHLEARRAHAHARASSSAPASTRRSTRRAPRSRPRAPRSSPSRSAASICRARSRRSSTRSIARKYVLLPNTAGCYTADDAIRTLHLARELGMDELVKLEVIGDPKTLFPDNTATVEAARRLVKEGFKVLPYCTDDLDHLQAARGRRLRRGDAARRADRLGPRHPQPAQHPPHHRERRRAGDRRRRRRHRVATRRSRWSSAAPRC